MKEEPSFEALDAAFEGAVERAAAGRGHVTVLFSGGVDSSLVAAAVRPYAEVDLFTVGLPGAADFEGARRAAEELGLRRAERVLGAADVAALLAVPELRDEREPRRSVLVALAAAFAAAPSRRLLVGQGADELFGGYAHFRGLSGHLLEQRRRADWDRLRDLDWPATQALARRAEREFAAPFLDPTFAEVALSLPLEPVGPGELTKPLLRRWALHRGLLPSIANRPKRALQYGSGISAEVRRATRATRPPR